MIIKYNIDIQNAAVLKSIDRITNQIFKLLPSREEGGDWITPLQNLIIELGGMGELLSDHSDLFPVLCRLEALLKLTNEEDFFIFRKVIFECLGLMNAVKVRFENEWA